MRVLSEVLAPQLPCGSVLKGKLLASLSWVVARLGPLPPHTFPILSLVDVYEYLVIGLTINIQVAVDVYVYIDIHLDWLVREFHVFIIALDHHMAAFNDLAEHIIMLEVSVTKLVLWW